jgi:hypothetical protein
MSGQGEHEATKAENGVVAFVRTYGKAITAAAVTTCAYLTGVSDGGISAQEWLGLIPFVAGAYGITAYAPYRPSGR